jgi:mRNA-degrading endonuclease RelE of RelBE toxin-antitoxin system
MAQPNRFAIIYDPQVKDPLRAVEKKYYSLIREGIERPLTFTPDNEARNRKPLAREVEFEANWELRLGPGNRFRVFYTVDLESREVHILAIGEKRVNRLYIGGKEIEI